MKKLTLLFLIMIFAAKSFSGFSAPPDSTWVDSVYRSLTVEQRIAQLLIIRAYSCRDTAYADSLCGIMAKYDPGGVCFFKGSPVRQANLTNRLQRSAQTPLLVSIDAEWGLGMRLDSVFSFPRQMALGAISDDSLIYKMGRMVAKSCRRMGIHINYAPVADINNNPKNPVIGFRSFGEDRQKVAYKAALYLKGMQDGGIMAVSKHFPGHGDTETDSHLDLPVINHSRQRMDSVELFPFKTLIREGTGGIMIGHLNVPCYDSVRNLPATLSRNIVTGLLKEELGFRGYVITDALDMQGVLKSCKPGDVEVRALQAGNDILLLPKNTEAAIRGIRTAIDSGWISPDLIEQKCRRILFLKYRLGLAGRQTVMTGNLVQDLNPPGYEALQQEMVKSSLTLLKNELQLVPLTGIDRRKFAVLSVGDTLPDLFQETLKRYVPVSVFNVPVDISQAMKDSIYRLVSAADVVILGVHGITSNVSDSFGITRPMIRLIDTIARTGRTILTIFGTPYSLGRIKDLQKPETILVAYQDNPVTEKAAAELIAGGIGARGKLPVTASCFKAGSGEATEATRLEFVMPGEIGLPENALRRIDSIAMKGIESRAYPGCQVLLAKCGRIFYEKSFGHPRYEDTVAVTPNDLYDIASVTKVAATTLAVMKLYDEGKLSLDDSLARHLPLLKGSNKAGLRIRDVMAHQAGLQDWIPFYKSTLVNGMPDPSVYRTEPSDGFPVRVASNLYISRKYADTILQRIIRSPLRPNRDYKYSDLGFYLLRLVVERLSGQPFDKYLEASFYKPLGLPAIGFNPRDRFELSRIIPTEYDEEFRKQLVRGDVHDPGAAMLGGISGHAGLFSNAYDLAVILQMLLQDGTYGGKQYLSPATVSEFTRTQFPGKGNRRGAGFDKPLIHDAPGGPSCQAASRLSFGHSGFTGTYIWADPDNGLLYVFLSNRVCPDAGNQKLSEMNIRTDIHQAAYDLLREYQIK